jgi:DNA-binding transcriptional regulator YiaG
MAKRHTEKGPKDLPQQKALTRQDLLRWLAAGPDLTVAQIRGLRERLGVTQLGLARMLGVCESAVSLWEAGRRPRGPAQRLLKLIAELAEAD